VVTVRSGEALLIVFEVYFSYFTSPSHSLMLTSFMTHPLMYFTNHVFIGIMNQTGAIRYQQDTTQLRFSFNATDPNSTLAFLEDLDRGFLLDGNAYMNALDHSGSFIPIVDPNTQYTIPFSFAFCQLSSPGFHPQDVYWDPQLTVLFTAPIPEEPEEPISPDTPLSAPLFFKKKVQTPLIIGLTLLGVALIAAFIVAYIFSPKLQSIFQPFKNAERTVHQESAVNRRWSAAVRAPAVNNT
jgi:hypothetical protein